MSDWKKKFADPILPEGDATFEINSIKFDETQGGTPFARITARISSFEDDYDPYDPSVLEPIGQTAWGTIWLPKEADDPKKAHNKQVRVRQFLELMEYAGADLTIPGGDPTPVDIFMVSSDAFAGKSFKSQIVHEVDENGVYPTKAAINTMRMRRA